jgi:hypothetical protein
VNKGSEPTFDTRVREQVFDITLSSASIWWETVKWRVFKEISLSDLRFIRLSMSADPKVPHENRNLLSTDWDWYKTDLASGFGGGLLTEDDIENSVNVLQSKIIAAYEIMNQSTPYWSSVLVGLRQVARRAWNNRSSNPQAYRKAPKEYARALTR